MPLRPELLVEEVRDLLGGHLLVGHQIEQHARVELAAARAHRQAVERGEAHGRGHRSPVLDRAHRGAVAEMRDDHVLARDLRRHLLQRAHDVFVRKAVEAVAAHALVVIGARQGEGVGHERDGCGGRPCRSRRPAACRERPESPPRCRRCCAAGAAARAGRACGAWRSPRRRSASASTSSGPPWTTRWPTAMMPLA